MQVSWIFHEPPMYIVVGKQFLISNDRNRFRRVGGSVLGLSQDGACTDLFENLSVKGDLSISNATTFNPRPHWSIPLNSQLRIRITFMRIWIRLLMSMGTVPVLKCKSLSGSCLSDCEIKILLFYWLTYIVDHLMACPPIRVADPDPDWIRIQSGQWIRIRDPDPDPGGQKWPTKVENN